MSFFPALGNYCLLFTVQPATYDVGFHYDYDIKKIVQEHTWDKNHTRRRKNTLLPKVKTCEKSCQ